LTGIPPPSFSSASSSSSSSALLPHLHAPGKPASRFFNKTIRCSRTPSLWNLLPFFPLPFALWIGLCLWISNTQPRPWWLLSSDIRTPSRIPEAPLHPHPHGHQEQASHVCRIPSPAPAHDCRISLFASTKHCRIEFG
jgi:hypothetical protein